MDQKRLLQAIYPTIVTILGVIAVGFLIQQNGLILTPVTGVLVALAILAELQPTRLPSGTITFSFVLVMLALMVPATESPLPWQQVMQATQVIVVGALLGHTALMLRQKERNPMRVLFYACHYGLVSSVAGALYVSVSKRVTAWGVVQAIHIPALAAYALGFALLSQVIVGIRNRLVQTAEETELPRTDILSAFLLAPLPLLAYYIYTLRNFNIAALLLILLPILAVLYTFRLYINIDTTHSEVQLLYDITQDFLTAVTQEETMEVVTRGIERGLRRLLAFEECLVFTLNEAANEYLLAYSSTDRTIAPVVSGKGLLGEVIGNGRGRIVNDLPATDSLTEDGDSWPERSSFLITPLIAEHLTVGLLVLVRYRKTFNAENFRLIGILAPQAAAVLRNAQLYEQTLRRAEIDPKTQLMQPKVFQERAQRELARSQVDSRASAIMLADIDDFRVINNTFGHQTGDEVLISLAQILSHVVGEQDLVARYGGEEFAILLSRSDSAEARAVAEGVRRAVEAHTFVTQDGREVRFTISMGVALFPTDGMDISTLLKKADRAAYLAKRMGKNQVRFYEAATEMIPPDEGPQAVKLEETAIRFQEATSV
ncbi:MAG: sensor domain-containing diguanylate cyclase [Chloroflexota bacterium]